MKLDAFSVRLSVNVIEASQSFYEILEFKYSVVLQRSLVGARIIDRCPYQF
jgi:hypothetical protein